MNRDKLRSNARWVVRWVARWGQRGGPGPEEESWAPPPIELGDLVARLAPVVLRGTSRRSSVVGSCQY